MPIRPEHIVNLQGRNYCLFAGLLNLAHESGLGSTQTELTQIPSAENGNVAIVRAVATFRGETGDAVWSAYGDASPANTRGTIQTALIRMAETRALGRVLRLACNVGETMLEELGGDDDQMASTKYPHGAVGNGAAAARARECPARPAAGVAAPHAVGPADGETAETRCIYGDCGLLLTKNQVTKSQHYLKLNLCEAHLKVMQEEQRAAAS
jgi:hypothetical protein